MTAITITPFLQFDEALHEYTLRGRKLNGVTTILKEAGIFDYSQYYTAEARDRGTAVHAAIHFFNEGDLDEMTLDPRVAGRFRGYLKFREAMKFEAIHNEFAMADPQLMFAGTTDTLGFAADKMVMVDFKSGAPCEWHGYQLAAYHHLVLKNQAHLSLTLREAINLDLWAVYLHDDDYRIQVVPRLITRNKSMFRPLPECRAIFLKCLEGVVTRAENQTQAV